MPERDFILNSEDIGEGPVVAVKPQGEVVAHAD